MRFLNQNLNKTNKYYHISTNNTLTIMKKDYLSPTTTVITLSCSTICAVSGLQSAPPQPEDWEAGETDWWNS